MFKQYYQRLNIALPKFLTALLVGLLLPPISAVTNLNLISQAQAVGTNPAPVCSGSTCSVTFTTADDFFTYTTPVANVSFSVKGGRGTGSGSIVTGTLNAAAGTVLTIYVGGAASGSTGGKSGGRNSGGSGATTNSQYNGVGGGGHSEIVIAGNSAVIAGGGGGNGGWSGGNGGIGGATRVSDTLYSGAAGTAGQAGGGTGGSNTGGSGGAGNSANAGTSGSLGLGGNGGYNSLVNGGGGGGGYYGGGGGGADSDSCCADGGGGGGGSSYVNATYISGSATFTTGNNAAGNVVISYASSYTVTFNGNSGTGSPSVASVSQASSGAAVTLATAGTLARSGFNLVGWNTNETGTGTTYSFGQSITPAANLTLYAQWNSYIQYSANGATSGAPPDSTTAKTALAATSLAANSGNLAKTGYTFGGWNTNETGTGTSYSLPISNYSSTGSTTLYARWDSLITYNGNGNSSGSVPSAATMFGTSGTLAAQGTLLKTVSSKSFTFGGWNTNETGTGTSYSAGASYSPTGNRTLYAQWNSVVTYNGNSNTAGTAPAATTITGVSGSLATNSGNLVNGSKVFAGWNTSSAGTGTRYVAGATYSNSGNLTLYAQWLTALSFTGSTSINVNQGSTFRSDTYTAVSGLDTKTVTYSLSPTNVGITLETSTTGSTTYAYIKVANTVSSGTYTDTLTATDAMGSTASVVVTIQVNAPLRWSNSNLSTLATTLGTAKNLQLDFANGGSNKTFTITQSTLMTNPGITLDTTTILSNYVTLKVAKTVGPGTYSVTVTGSDASGAQSSSVITVTVNQPLSMTRNSNLVAIGLGSQKFAGTGQYLSLPAGSRWAIGGTWTLEWWQYETGTATEKSIIKMAGNAFGVGITATSLYLYNNSSFTTLTSSLVEADRKNKWTHFAIVSDSGTVYAYQNGIRLNATGINFGSVTSTYAPSNYAMCVGTKCSALDGSTGSSTNYFGGYIANLMIHKRIDYTGTSTSAANFTPGYNLNIDSRTVVALALLPGDSVLSDLSNSALTVTQRGNAAVGSTDFPNLTSPDVVVLETTQGKPRVTYAFNAEGGTGTKTMTSSSDTIGLVTTFGYSGVLFHKLNESATAVNSTTVRNVYETVTATDASGAVLQAKSKLIINPQVALSATTWNLSVPAGVEAFDTITAVYGTGSKTISMVGSPSTSAIEVYSNVYGSDAKLVIRVTKNATVGTYYETLTAYDLMSDIETAVVTITVTPGLSLTSASGSTSLTATAGKAASLQLNAENGSGTKTFALTHLGAVSAGITIDTTTVVGAAILKIATSVPAGTYSEKITVTDAQGTSVSITISVTVNQAPTISYTGSTSGAITLTTTAGKALTSGAFTAALGTGTRTLSLSGVNSQVSIDTSTANIGYFILGSGLTATNSTTDKTYYETITVTDSLSATSIRAVTIVVKPAISQTASFLTLNTTAGVSITDTVTASYGTGNKTFSLAISPNVSGISFTNSVTNRAVITVANTLSPGTYTITVTATDSVSATSSIDITLNVASSLSISGSSSITSTAGYSFTSPAYSATGGSGNTSFALVSPPAGVTLSASTGSPSILVGIAVTAATYNLTLRATDSVTATTTFAVTLLVNPPVSLSGPQTITKDYGTSGTYIFNTSGGTAPFTFSTTNICATEVSTSGGITTEKIMGVSSCDWQVPAGVTSLSGVLVVGGGGGGGWGNLAGGGGAGEVESSTAAIAVTPGSKIAVTVGAGGEDGYNESESSWRCGFNGENSVFGSVIALGGGAGAGSTNFGCINDGSSGGSGGGANWNSAVVGTSTKSSQTGWVAYGNSGGNNTGGGGGAGASGNPWSAADGTKGKGGAGITLMGMTFAGGGGAWNGGGATNGNETGGTGGGGRARGGSGFPCNSCDATSGTGSGGGAGGRGGSGFIAIQYPTPATAASTNAFTFQTISKTSTGQLQLTIPEGVAADTYTSTIKVFNDLVSNNQVISSSYSLTIIVNKATPTLSLSIPGGGTTVTYGSPVTISASSTTAGNFDFKKGGTTISGCGTKATSSGVATCSWTPTDTSTAVISAAFTPTDSGNWKSVTSTNLTLTVSQADTLTVTFGAQDFNYTGSAVSVSRSYTLSGLTSIDSITAVTTLITGTANDSSSYSSNTGPTKAGAYSLTGTAVTFSGSTKASYYKSIVYVPANININRAANVISLRYGSNNIVTYKPTGVETATAGYLGTGAISYSTSSSTYCSVDSSSGDLTTILAGSCDVSLSVGQGSNYLGDTVTATVTINKASRTIAISSSKSSLKYSETATVTTTINFDGSDGAISYSVGSTTGCSFDQANNLLTAISGTATCALAATIGEGANYLSATSSTLSFTLSKADAPTLTLIAPANIDYSPSATSSDIPLPTFTLTGLKLDDTATALSNMTITYLASGTYAYNSTTVPTGANVYTITPSSLTLSTGDISNYQSPNIVSASWTINQIAQAVLLVTSLLQEGITVPYDVQYTGGSTNGTVTANIVAGGTATNCSFVGNSLRANSSGSCVIQLTMAGNQNYLAVSSETITVVIANFVQSIFNFDSLASGSTGITITSEVPYTVDVEQCSSECVPTIASISQTTFQGGDQLVITGTDFLGATAVVFNRTVFVTVGNGMQVDDNSQITVVVPMGLTAGAGSISVKNDLKISARLGGLTITDNPVFRQGIG